MLPLLILLLTSTEVLNSSITDVCNIVQNVLADLNFPIAYASEGLIITEKQDIALEVVNNYIKELWPDENPGWTSARVQITVTLQSVDKSNTRIDVKASFERYGTPNAYLLIPPEWKEVPSNGKFENELLASIMTHFSKRRGQ